MDDLPDRIDSPAVQSAAPASTETCALPEGDGSALEGSAPPAGIPQFKPGEVVDDRFVVIRFIARGGMGEVYEVEDRQLRGVHVALKTILSRYAVDPAMRQRFEREVLSAREVVHPNLCPIYDLGHWRRPDSHVTYLTMKLLSGESLASRIVRTGPIPGEELLCILKQVGAGIAAAHDGGVLHRDIKSANIIVRGSGARISACVTDFGLARATFSEETVVTVQGVAGTPAFMAPELFHGASPTKASDVYALGVVAYQALTGRFPQSSSNAAEIPGAWRRFIGGCLKPEMEKRFQTIPEAMQALPSEAVSAEVSPERAQRITRRKMLAWGTGASAAAAAGVWLEWPRILNVLEPLPSIRFVALMALPTDRPPALLFAVLASIGRRLARAEASVKNLLIISPRDRPGPVTAIETPEETESALGANLVLTASLDQTVSRTRLHLRLLDAHAQHVLRESTVECLSNRISSLAEEASRAAATLLQLPAKDVQLSDPEELKSVPPRDYQAFSEAEQLMNQPNHAGLSQAIAKYESAIDLDGHFALAYARLAVAYLQQFNVTKEPANVDLASRNAVTALFYNPHSAMGLMSQAMVYVYQGKSSLALEYFGKAEQADPGNPDVLYHEAWAFEHQGQLKEAEQAYRNILVQRPNFWPAYNNLGVILTRQARYEDAAKAFAAAGAAAPKVAQPMANLAQTYMEMGRRDDARTALKESLARADNEDAWLALGDLDFEDAKYSDALKDYQHAGKLDPRNHLIERNMGDCYFMLGNAAMVSQSYTRAAQFLSAQLQTSQRDGFGWANLAFYQAKIGNRADADADLSKAKTLGANDVASRFMMVQALDVLGRKQEALDLLLWCMDKGLSPVEVNLAVDLKDLRTTRAYQERVKEGGGKGRASTA
ncbi:MAG TPA: protein kinase [Acidobacteriaceae bacterium]|jgi:serine/threonine protein kinase|nr:protein kinase [Acidobacteriaceae bacterium]